MPLPKDATGRPLGGGGSGGYAGLRLASSAFTTVAIHVRDVDQRILFWVHNCLLPCQFGRTVSGNIGEGRSNGVERRKVGSGGRPLPSCFPTPPRGSRFGGHQPRLRPPALAHRRN